MPYRCTIALNPTSALPDDTVTMTMHFHMPSGAIVEAEMDDIAQAVLNLINVPVGADVELSTMFAKSIADDGHQLRFYGYNVATGARTTYEGAPPDRVTAFALTNRGAETVGLPQETALKVTIRNTTAVAKPLARRTGGVYFGPLEGANLVEGDGGFAVPPASAVLRIVNAFEAMAEDPLLATTPLVVWSRPFEGRDEIIRPGRPPLPALPARAGSTEFVTQIFVDDEFDTQRRRGRRGGVRTIRSIA